MTPDRLAIVILSATTFVLVVVVLWQWRRAHSGRTCGDVRDLMRQLDRLADDIDRRMGGALGDMQAAIDQADERIEALHKPTEAPEAPEGGQGPTHDEPAQHAETHEATDTPAARPTNLDVLRLSRDGLDSAEIAGQLDRPVGEVDLILRLHAVCEPAPQAQQQQAR